MKTLLIVIWENVMTDFTTEDKVKWLKQLMVFQKNVDSLYEREYGYKQVSAVPLIESIIKDLIEHDEMIHGEEEKF